MASVNTTNTPLVAVQIRQAEQSLLRISLQLEGLQQGTGATSVHIKTIVVVLGLVITIPALQSQVFQQAQTMLLNPGTSSSLPAPLLDFSTWSTCWPVAAPF